MTRPTAYDEQFVHQIPELLPNVARAPPALAREPTSSTSTTRTATPTATCCSSRWRTTPRAHLDSLQMGRVGGDGIFGYLDRPADGDPHTLAVPGIRFEVVRPWEKIRIVADPAVATIACDLTFTARTQPYGLRRGTMRAATTWCGTRATSSSPGTYAGTFTVAGETRVGRRLDRPA